MWRKQLLVGSALLLIVSCSSLQMQPLSAETRSDGGRKGPAELHRVPLESRILGKAELKRVSAEVMPDCSRLSMLRSAQREVLVGYREKAMKPAILASISRMGDPRGSLVLAVGLDLAKGRITRAATLSPKGKLHGLKAYAKKKVKFLEQFAKLPADSDFKKVDAVTGATHLTKAIRSRVQTEAKLLKALKVEALLQTPAKKKP